MLPRETIPDSCSCLDDCECMCLDCLCENWGDDDVFRDQGSGAYSPGSSQANLTSLPATWSTGPAWHSGLMSVYMSG